MNMNKALECPVAMTVVDCCGPVAVGDVDTVKTRFEISRSGSDIATSSIMGREQT